METNHRNLLLKILVLVFVVCDQGIATEQAFSDNHNSTDVSLRKADAAARDLVSLTNLDVMQFGGDFEQWGDSWADTTPTRLKFRWTTNYKKVGSATWQVRDASGNTVASGQAGKVPGPGQRYQTFYIDFASIVSGTSERPLHYSVQLLTFEKSRETQAADSGLLTKKTDDTGLSGRATASNIVQRFGKLSAPVGVSIVAPGAGTQFTDTGLDPSLLESMRIRIDLEELDILGEGYDEDPYLMVAVVLADGTSIVPAVTGTPARVTFGGSSVRVLSKSKTHENVPGGDPGDEVAIPASTGQFEATIRPIGLALARSFGATEAQLQTLRENTDIAILVIGMEEDAIPSTEVINESRELFIRRLTEELNAIVQGISLPAALPLDFPDLNDVVAGLRGQLKDEITEFAKSEGIEELGTLLGIHAWPMLISLGAGNQDDYIGQDRVTFSYQQLLDAGTDGFAFELLLDQNCKCNKPWYIQNKRSEDIFYEIDGRIRRLP